jgi:hypothetical protein
MWFPGVAERDYTASTRIALDTPLAPFSSDESVRFKPIHIDDFTALAACVR